MATSSYELDADGSKFIPATQRPDGTWRKPRRVRDGYVPQEEVPLYESKGKQFAARQNTGLPVGLTPEIVAEAQRKKVSQPIPGLIINIDKKKKKKKTAVDETADKLTKLEISEPSFSSPSSSSIASNEPVDPVKRLRVLRKKLREIEMLEDKIKTGNLKTPDKDQKEKLSKKRDILKEIAALDGPNSEHLIGYD